MEIFAWGSFSRFCLLCEIYPHAKIKLICLYEGNMSSIMKNTPTWNALTTFSRNFLLAKITTFTVPLWYMYSICISCSSSRIVTIFHCFKFDIISSLSRVLDSVAYSIAVSLPHVHKAVAGNGYLSCKIIPKTVCFISGIPYLQISCFFTRTGRHTEYINF